MANDPVGFSIDVTQFIEFQGKLDKLALTANPRAIRNTMNRAAFDSQREARQNIRREFVNRNSYTERSVRVEKATSLDIDRMQSKVGSITDYMDEQEVGGNKERRGGKNDVIPTRAAAGQTLSPGGGMRTKPVSMRYRLQALQLQKKTIKAANKNQELLVKVIDAVQTGERVIYHETKAGKRGIFRVIGGKMGRRKKFTRRRGGLLGGQRASGWPRGARLEMLYDLSAPAGSITVRPSPWLRPAFRATQARMPGFYRDALNIELDRLGLPRIT